MKPLHKTVAAHPIVEAPYTAIKFARVDGCGTTLYTVGNDAKAMGAEKALRAAYKNFGGRCFHCNKPIKSKQFTLDHLRSKKDDGDEHLHNLVFACRPCNLSKGCKDIVEYRPKITMAYLKALDAHLVRCLKKLDSK
jgi:hypothetical protein